MRLDLDNNESAALATALENYLNGHGMDDSDEDEGTIENILTRLNM